jgi:hypothetical protein
MKKKAAAKKKLEPAPVQKYDYFTFLNDKKAVVIIDISDLKK